MQHDFVLHFFVGPAKPATPFLYRRRRWQIHLHVDRRCHVRTGDSISPR